MNTWGLEIIRARAVAQHTAETKSPHTIVLKAQSYKDTLIQPRKGQSLWPGSWWPRAPQPAP